VLVPAIESEIMLSPEELKAFEGVAIFDYERVNSGYAWIFPKSDHVSVGIGAYPKKGLQLNRLFDDYKRKMGLGEGCVERNRKGFVVPVRPRTGPYMKGCMLIVGDAAGFADPISAEGFTYALKSGLEAGKAVSTGLHNPAEVYKLYHSGIDAAVVQELFEGRKIAILFYFSSRVRNFLMNRYGQRLCEGMARVVEGRQTYSEVISRRPIIRWLLGVKITSLFKRK